MKPIQKTAGLLALLLCLLLGGCEGLLPTDRNQAQQPASVSLDEIPDYSGEPYVVIHDNQPDFAPGDRTATSFEEYSELDGLGRCGVAYANVGADLMPTQERGSIGQVKPTGWQTVKYDCVDGKYLYNRCHLIGWQLTGENANEQNLITGTRYLNVDGMLPFENMTADYIKETGNHVLYRVTPIFEGENLVAGGVQMEGYSVEDEGDGVCFNVYVYNVQPGVTIDYRTGESWESDDTVAAPGTEGTTVDYTLNTGSHKFHLPSCAGAASMSEKNRETFTGTRDQVAAMGYEPCGQCRP